MMELEEIAGKYYVADAGKSVPLDLLKAWLYEYHIHQEDAPGPLVYSMDLQRWAEGVAR